MLFKRSEGEIIKERIWRELKWHAYLSPIFIVVCSIILLWPTYSKADLPGWSYHKTIIVKENSGSDLYDYQIKVTLDSENFDFSKANPDGSDIRFLENGVLLSYWIERWVYGNEATIWVKIPHISPYEKKEIDLYYGNPTASSESNLQATMDFLEIQKVNTTDTAATGENGNDPSTWTWDNVTLSTTFTNPVVIAQYPSYNNTESAVVRIKDSTSTSLSLRIIEPSLRDNVHPPETVGVMVLNEGTYQFLDGTRIEAHKYETRSTAGGNVSPDVWDSQIFSLTYTQTGSDPIVFAQPMTSNDTTQEARFLKTRLNDLRDNDGYFQVALEEEYDNTTQRTTTETVAWIAVERNGTTGTITETISNETNDPTPTPYEVGISYDNVQGIGNGWTTVNFAQSFTTPPVLILSYGSYDGGDNSELRYQNETTQSFQVAIEEDYTRGSAMETTTAHITEDAFYLAFGEEGILPIAKRVDPEPTVVVLGIKGKIFEDADAGGDAYTAGEDEVKSDVEVRLYREADENNTLSRGDVFITETQTDISGTYYLPGKEGNTYFVVVNSKDVKPAPNNEGYNEESTQGAVWAEQTYEKVYIGGVYLEQQKYGGGNAQVSDNFTSSTTLTDNNYEHVARVDLDVEKVLEIDFGFSFEVATNTRDGDDDASHPRTIQGSLRQVLQNANAIKDGQSIVFRIPTTDPSYNSNTKEFVIAPSNELPYLTDDFTVVDGKTQSDYNQGRVVLDGSGLAADGLTSKGCGTEIKNLTFKNFNRGVNVWGWPYQRAITIDYAGSTTLTAYQIMTTLSPSNFDYSKAKSDGSDIRFMTPEGEMLDYWIHNWDTSGTSRIWINVPTITPSSVTTITMLYGNPTATNQSNPYSFLNYRSIKLNRYVVSDKSSQSDLRVLSLQDRATIQNNSTSETVNLNLKESYNFLASSIYPTTSFSSNKPFSSVFTADAAETLVSISFASTSFGYYASRNSPEIDILSPFGDATVTISLYTLAGSLVSQITTSVPQNNNLHYTFAATRNITIESNLPLLSTYDASTSDSFIMYPASNELFTIGSQNIYVTALQDNTSLTAYLTYESGTQTAVSTTLNRGAGINLATIAPYPFTSQGSGPAVRLVSNNPIGAIQYADGDGLESTSGWGRKDLSTVYGIPVETQYIAISAPYPETEVWIERPDGTTMAPTASVQAQGEYPGKFFFGSTSNGVFIPQGSVLYSNKPVYIYIEQSSTNDEKNVEGAVQNRQQIYPEPTVSLGSEEAADSKVNIERNNFTQNNKGVSVSNGNGVKITQNTFSKNATLPIDLSDDSTTTPNDGLINIELTNKGMDYPVITHAELDPRGWSLYVEGYIGTDPTSPTEQANFSGCTIEVYTSNGDFSGYGEGGKYLGSGQTTSTNSFSFNIDVRNKGVTRGTTITAIALHPDPTASEFSTNTTVAGGPVISNVWAKHIYYNREATSPPPPQTTITWNTDIPATSQVVYDTTSHASPTAAYAYSSLVNLTPTTSHVVTITNVTTNTFYFYRVKSTSTEGYLSISPEFKLPPGGTAADTDLCASCHRGHTAPHLAIPPQRDATPLLFPLISNP